MTPTDTLTDEPHVEAEMETAAQPAEQTKRPRASTSFDAGRMIAYISMPGAELMAFDASKVSEATRLALMGRGLCHFLTSNEAGPVAAFDKLIDGDYGRKPAAPKPLDDKRQAIANALVEFTKRSDAPVSQADADERARGMTRAEVEHEMLTPIVVKHFGKISGPKSALFR